jgi:hypothetical protein
MSLLFQIGNLASRVDHFLFGTRVEMPLEMLSGPAHGQVQDQLTSPYRSSGTTTTPTESVRLRGTTLITIGGETRPLLVWVGPQTMKFMEEAPGLRLPHWEMIRDLGEWTIDKGLVGRPWLVTKWGRFGVMELRIFSDGHIRASFKHPRYLLGGEERMRHHVTEAEHKTRLNYPEFSLGGFYYTSLEDRRRREPGNPYNEDFSHVRLQESPAAYYFLKILMGDDES